MRKNGHKKAHLDVSQVSFLRKRRYIFLFFMIYLFLFMAAVTRRPAQAFFDRLQIKAIRGKLQSASSRPAAAGQRSPKT